MTIYKRISKRNEIQNYTNMKWVFTAALLLLFVSVDARGGRRIQRLSRQRESNGDCGYVQAWSPNRVYTYDYVTKIKQGIESERPEQLITLSCAVKITAVRRCDAVMNLENCRLEGSEIRSQSQVEQLMRLDTAFSFNGGAITEVQFHRDEEIEVKNIKRGILSNLQMQFPPSRQMQEGQSYTIREMSIRGTGNVEHIVKEVSQRVPSIIEVIRDGSQLVLPWERDHTSVGSMDVSNVSPFFDVVQTFVLKTLDDNMVKPTQTCEYRLERGRMIVSVKCLEVHSFNATNSFWSESLLESLSPMNIVIEQTIERQDVARMNGRSKPNLRDSEMSKDNIMFEKDAEEIVSLVKSAYDPVPLLNALINNPVDHTTPLRLAGLERWLTLATQEEINEVWRTCSSHLSDQQRAKASGIWVELLSSCSSNYWCQGHVPKRCKNSNQQCSAELTHFIERIASHGDQDLTSTILNTLSKIPKPEISVVAAAHTLCRLTTTPKTVQHFGDVLAKYLMGNPESQEKEIVKAKSFISRLIDNGCAEPAQTSYEIQVEALKCMRKMGKAFSSHIDRVITCAESHSAPKWVNSAALATLGNITDVEIPGEIKTKLMSMLSDQSKPIETKLLCYRILMTKSLTSQDIRQILQSTLVESEEEMKDYVSKHLQSQILLRNTRYCTMKPDVTNTLSKLLVQGEWNINMEADEITREPVEKSNIFEKRIFIPYLDMEIPCKVSTSLVFVDDSQIPVMCTANITAVIDNREVNLLKAGVDLLSLRSMLEDNMQIDLSKPEGLFKVLNLPIEEILSNAFSHNRNYESEQGLAKLQQKAVYGYLNGLMKTTKPYFFELFDQPLEVERLYRTPNLRNVIAGNVWQLLHKVEEGFVQNLITKTKTPLYVGRSAPSSAGIFIVKKAEIAYIYEGKADVKANLFGIRWSDRTSGRADISQTLKSTVALTHQPMTKLCTNCIQPKSAEFKVGHVTDFEMKFTKEQNQLTLEIEPRTQVQEILSVGLSSSSEDQERNIEENCYKQNVFGLCVAKLCNKWEVENKLLSVVLESEDLTPSVIEFTWGESESEQSLAQLKAVMKFTKGRGGSPNAKLAVILVPSISELTCSMSAPESSLDWQARFNMIRMRESNNRVNGMFISFNCSRWSSSQIEYINTMTVMPPNSDGRHAITGHCELPTKSTKLELELVGELIANENLRSLEYKVTEPSGEVNSYTLHEIKKLGEESYVLKGLYYGKVPLFGWKRQEFKYVSEKRGENDYKKFVKFTGNSDIEGRGTPTFYVTAVSNWKYTSPKSYIFEYRHADTYQQLVYKSQADEKQPSYRVESAVYFPSETIPLSQVERDNDVGQLVSNETHPGIPMWYHVMEFEYETGLMKAESIYQYRDEYTNEVKQLFAELSYSKPRQSCEKCYNFKFAVPGIEIRSMNDYSMEGSRQMHTFNIHRSYVRKIVNIPAPVDRFILGNLKDNMFNFHYTYKRTWQPSIDECTVKLLNNDFNSYLKYQDNELISHLKLNVGIPMWNTKSYAYLRVNSNEGIGETNFNCNSTWSGSEYYYRGEGGLTENESAPYDRRFEGKLYKMENGMYHLNKEVGCDVSSKDMSMRGNLRSVEGDSEITTRYTAKFKDEENNLIKFNYYCQPEYDVNEQPCYVMYISLENPEKFVYKSHLAHSDEEFIRLSKVDNEWACTWKLDRSVPYLKTYDIRMKTNPVYYFSVNDGETHMGASMGNDWNCGLLYKHEKDNLRKHWSFNTSAYDVQSECNWETNVDEPRVFYYNFKIQNRILATSPRKQVDILCKHIPGMYEVTFDHPDLYYTMKSHPQNPASDVDYPVICEIEIRPNNLRIKKLKLPINYRSSEPQRFHITDANIRCPHSRSCAVENLAIDFENVYSGSRTSVRGNAAIEDGICTIKLSDSVSNPVFDIDVKMPLYVPEAYGQHHFKISFDKPLFKLGVNFVYNVQQNNAIVSWFHEFELKNPLSESPKYYTAGNLGLTASQSGQQNFPSFGVEISMKPSKQRMIKTWFNVTDQEQPSITTGLETQSVKLISCDIEMRGCVEKTTINGMTTCVPEVMMIDSLITPMSISDLFRERELTPADTIKVQSKVTMKPCNPESSYDVSVLCVRPMQLTEGSVLIPRSAWETLLPIEFPSGVQEEMVAIRDLEIAFNPQPNKITLNTRAQVMNQEWSSETVMNPELLEWSCRMPESTYHVKRSSSDGQWQWKCDIDTPMMTLHYAMEWFKEWSFKVTTKNQLRTIMPLDIDTEMTYGTEGMTGKCNVACAFGTFDITMTTHGIQCHVQAPGSPYYAIISGNWQYRSRPTYELTTNVLLRGESKVVMKWSTSGMGIELNELEVIMHGEDISSVKIEMIEDGPGSKHCHIDIMTPGNQEVSCVTSSMSPTNPRGTFQCNKNSRRIASFEVNLSEVPFMTKSSLFESMKLIKRRWEIMKYIKAHSVEEIARDCQTNIQDREFCMHLATTAKHVEERESGPIVDLMHLDDYINEYEPFVQTYVNHYVSKINKYNPTGSELSVVTYLSRPQSPIVLQWGNKAHMTIKVEQPTPECVKFSCNVNSKLSWLNGASGNTEFCLSGTTDVTMKWALGTNFNGEVTFDQLIPVKLVTKCFGKEIIVAKDNTGTTAQYTPYDVKFLTGRNTDYECKLNIYAESWQQSSMECFRTTTSGGRQSVGSINFADLPTPKRLIKMTLDSGEIEQYLTDENGCDTQFVKYITDIADKCRNSLIRFTTKMVYGSENNYNEYSDYIHKLIEKCYKILYRTVRDISNSPEEQWSSKITSELHSLYNDMTTSWVGGLEQAFYLMNGELKINVHSNPQDRTVTCQLLVESEIIPAMNSGLTIVLRLPENEQLEIETHWDHPAMEFKSKSVFYTNKVKSNITFGSEDSPVITRYISYPDNREEIYIKMVKENSKYSCKCDAKRSPLYFRCKRLSENEDPEDMSREPTIGTWKTNIHEYPLISREYSINDLYKLFFNKDSRDEEEEEVNDMLWVLRRHQNSRYNHVLMSSFDEENDNEDEDFEPSPVNDIVVKTISSINKKLIKSEYDQQPMEAYFAKNLINFALNLCRPVLRPLARMAINAEINQEVFYSKKSAGLLNIGFELASRKYPIINSKYNGQLGMNGVSRDVITTDCFEYEMVSNFENILEPTISSWKIVSKPNGVTFKLLPTESSLSSIKFTATDERNNQKKCVLALSPSIRFARLSCFKEGRESQPIISMKFGAFDVLKIMKYCTKYIYSDEQVTMQEIVEIVDSLWLSGDEREKREFNEHTILACKQYIRYLKACRDIWYNGVFSEVPMIGKYVDPKSTFRTMVTMYSNSQSFNMGEIYEKCVELMAKVATKYNYRTIEIIHEVVLSILQQPSEYLSEYLPAEVWDWEQFAYLWYRVTGPVKVTSLIMRTNEELQIVPFDGINYYKIPSCALRSEYLLATDAVGESFSVTYTEGTYKIVLPRSVLEMTEDFQLYFTKVGGSRIEVSLPFEDAEEVTTRCYRDEDSFVCRTGNVTVAIQTSIPENLSAITHVTVEQRCIETTAGLLGSPMHPVQESYQKLCGLTTPSFKEFIDSCMLSVNGGHCQVPEQMRNSSIPRSASSEVCLQVFEPSFTWFNIAPRQGYLKACEDNCQRKEKACVYGNAFVGSVQTQGIPVPQLESCRDECTSERPVSTTVQKTEVNILISLSSETSREFPQVKTVVKNLVRSMRQVKQSEGTKYSFRLLTVGGEGLMYIPQIRSEQGLEEFPFNLEWNIPTESDLMNFNGPKCTPDSISRCIRDAYTVSSRATEGVSKIFIVVSPFNEIYSSFNKPSHMLTKLTTDDAIRTFIMSPFACQGGSRKYSSSSQYGFQPILTDAPSQPRCFADPQSSAEYLLNEQVTLMGESMRCRCRVVNWFTGETVSMCEPH